jgi:ubiquinone/menaquinone biosynthesis C-methylase UbiE
MDTVRDSYNSCASNYYDKLKCELDYKEIDRKLLFSFATTVIPGKIADIGCGPGHVTIFLNRCGAEAVMGVDISDSMVEVAKSKFPELEFIVGDMLCLPIDSETLAGIVAFYSIVHLSPETINVAFKEFYRVLKPGGSVMVSFHRGSHTKHFDSMFDCPVDLTFQFFETQQAKESLEAQGFVVTSVVERDPVPEEAQTQRTYILAQKT